MTTREEMVERLIDDAISVLHHDGTEGAAVDIFERDQLRKRFAKHITPPSNRP